jgi:hypothetical protein
VLFELSILLARWIDRIKPVADDDEDDKDEDGFGSPDAYDGGHFDGEEHEDDLSVAGVDPPKLQEPEPKD